MAEQQDIEKFSVVVIGAGCGGLCAARFAAKMGAKVLLVGEHVAGDSSISSKALIKVAKKLRDAKNATQFASTEEAPLGGTAPPKVEWRTVRDCVKGASWHVEKHDKSTVLESQGITVVIGTASFIDDHRLAIIPSGERTNIASPRTVYGEHILICTGARPAVPAFIQASGVFFHTYENIFDISSVPDSMVFLGGEPLSCELGQAFARLGTRVTIVAERLLPKEDEDAQLLVREVLAREGVLIQHRNATIVRAGENDSVVVVLDNGQELTASKIFVGCERKPVLDSLNLEAAKISYNDDGIITDNNLRTNVHHIYAAGDCSGSEQYAHYAGWQAVRAVRNFLLPSSDKGVCDFMPRVTFVDPEVASVGMSEREFKATFGERAEVLLRGLEHVDKAVSEGGQDVGFIKLLVNDGKIRGATVVCQQASEAINEITMAMTNGLTVKQIGKTIHAYPSYGFAIQQMCQEASVEGMLHGITGTLVNLFKKV